MGEVRGEESPPLAGGDLRAVEFPRGGEVGEAIARMASAAMKSGAATAPGFQVRAAFMGTGLSREGEFR